MLSSKRDQSQFSLNNNNASLRSLRGKVIRINKMIKRNMSRLSRILQVNVVLKRTVVVDSD